MELDRKKIDELLKSYEEVITEESSYKPEFSSQEYRKFLKEKEEMNKPRNWYEKLCHFSRKLGLEMSEKDREILRKDIMFANLNIKEDDVLNSFMIVIIITLILWAIFYLFFSIIPFKNIPLVIKHLPILVGLSFAYYIYKYPSMKAGINRVRYGSDLMMATLYMIMYLRNAGNLEGAVRYTSQHMKGKIANDFKELLWKVEIGEYGTIDEALAYYGEQWRDYLNEFTQAIYLIKEALIEGSYERREAILDKALDIILVSSDERMKGYSRALELPVQVIHVIGVLLPVLGMVVLPILTIMLSEKLTNLTFYLFLFYDVTLPIVLWFFITQTLQKRPSTLGKVDISMHPLLPKPGRFFYKGKELPINPLVFGVGGGILTLLLLVFWQLYSLDKNSNAATLLSILLVLTISIVIAVKFYLDVFQKVKIRDEIEQVEKEFEEALFALGNATASNMPIEKALEKSLVDMQGLKIANFFNIIMENMSLYGMNFKEAVFNKERGAIKFYPSSLISSIMNIVSEAINKGSDAAALTMVTISRYLRSIRTTQEKINDLLSSTLSNMKFNAYILIPIIGGIIVGVSKLILLLLLKMSGMYAQLQEQLILEGNSEMAKGLMDDFIFSVDNAVPAPITQLIIGIYVIEMLVLLGMFISRINWGFDEIKEKAETWKVVIIGALIYVISFVIISNMFSSIIENIAAGFNF